MYVHMYMCVVYSRVERDGFPALRLAAHETEVAPILIVSHLRQ